MGLWGKDNDVVLYPLFFLSFFWVICLMYMDRSIFDKASYYLFIIIIIIIII
ncbi:hypothetical protein QBC44DRAFT_332953 [Cladorrhinum sp. PSN332]|nr:hypothetical protein QBC44DRAFT_332953 [Cladorrhinum sp. PSN332]